MPSHWIEGKPPMQVVLDVTERSPKRLKARRTRVAVHMQRVHCILSGKVHYHDPENGVT